MIRNYLALTFWSCAVASPLLALVVIAWCAR